MYTIGCVCGREEISRKKRWCGLHCEHTSSTTMGDAELSSSMTTVENHVPRLGRSQSKLRIRDHINAFFGDDPRNGNGASDGNSEGDSANCEHNEKEINGPEDATAIPILCGPSTKEVIPDIPNSLLYQHFRYQRRRCQLLSKLYFDWHLWTTHGNDGLEEPVLELKSSVDIKKANKLIKQELRKERNERPATADHHGGESEEEIRTQNWGDQGPRTSIHVLRAGLEPRLDCPLLPQTVFMKAPREDDETLFFEVYEAIVNECLSGKYITWIANAICFDYK